jgi:multidrug resistance efflux pump
MSKKKAYHDKLQSQLDQWRAEIGKLQAKAQGRSAQAQLDYHRQVEELRSMQADAEKKLDELRQAGDEAWEDLKSGIDMAWDALGKSVKSAALRFN